MHTVDRRQFLATAGAAAVSLTSPALAAPASLILYASPTGDDDARGTLTHPLRTIARAITLVRERRTSPAHPAQILLRTGTYELATSLQLTAADSNITIAAYGREEPVISGGTRLSLNWQPYRDGIFQATVPAGTTTDQLFINGRRQVLARYPNFDPSARFLNGTAADAISPARAARWSNPSGGYIHALQKFLWGSLHYRITGKDASNKLQYEGGWQMDRNQPMHDEYRFVENVFEELDSPSEWFLNPQSNTLYFYPPAGPDLASATVDIVRLENLIHCAADSKAALRNFALRGITFRHTLRTFMQTREPLLRSDWHIYRGGALFFEGAEDLAIQNCTFDQLGGNTIFLSGYHRRANIARCHIRGSGASGICFAGRPEAVRNPLISYDQRLSLADLDRTPGPLTPDYPKDCTVDDCLIVATGRVEKQSAPIEIAMSQSITVRSCSIYAVPRAGINIGDGCWGGHRIEHCDVFDAVLETGDHGAFNSWGRDRWWGLKDANPDTFIDGTQNDLPTLDAVLPNTLFHTRWACEHGWDIDLDDGSSNYQISQNLCLCGGIKFREGFFRTCENNIMVRNTLHPHVWPADSKDIVLRNIVFVLYRPIRPEGWGKSFDDNLLHITGQLHPKPASPLQHLSGQDAHSLMSDAQFVDLDSGDCTLKPHSPALALGFKNFPMHNFGVRSPRLRALAKTPDIARLLRTQPTTLGAARQAAPIQWLGATVRNLVGMAEVSAFGAPGETGVVIETVPPASALAAAGVVANDLLLSVQGTAVEDTAQLQRLSARWAAGQSLELTVLRHQQTQTLHLAVP